MTRKEKALKELDYLEKVLDVYETPDFVEVIGGQGGDIETYRVYFEGNNITCIGMK